MDPSGALSEAEKIELYERLARKALAVYRLEDADLHLLGQSANVVFRVETEDGRWALRIGDPNHDRKTLMRELLWLVALSRDTRLVVPEPVIARTGELVRGVSMRGLSGFHACTLFRWVKGHFETDPTPEHLRAVGSFTATLHKHAETFRWPEDLAPEADLIAGVERRAPRTLLRTHYPPNEAELLCSVVPIIQRTMRSVGVGRDTAGVIHADLHQGNYLFHDGEARAIDFECVEWSFYAYDLATTLGYLNARSDFEVLRSAYLEGYASIRPLPCDPGTHLQAFDMLRALTMTSWILSTQRLRAADWAAGVLASAVRKAERLVGGA